MYYPEQLTTQASKRCVVAGAGEVPAVGRAARIVQAAFTLWELPVPTATPFVIHFLLP